MSKLSGEEELPIYIKQYDTMKDSELPPFLG
jgi:hypothetical protein